MSAPGDLSKSCIGILGGSFDPPHYGHLALAETARVQLNLDLVLFVPAGVPPHKQNHPLSAPEHRAAMVQAAIADNHAFRLSRVDLDRPGPHYTADMLATLKNAHAPEITWFLLMGEDSLRDLPKWYRPEEILNNATLAVMPRHPEMAGLDLREDAAMAFQLAQLNTRIVWLDVPPVDFSATDLRRRARMGLPLRYLVPSGVAGYVEEMELYQR